MDAKSFISKKHDAAVEELKTLEAEYNRKKEAAMATIEMAKKWLDELGPDREKAEQGISIQEFTKKPNENWVSARDLTARVPQSGA